MSTIGERLASVRQRIADTCKLAARALDEVTLVAVSKTRSRAEIMAAYEAGQRVFGENRVQEAKAKYDAGLPSDVVLRMVGHLQKNKVRDAVAVCDSIDSVDDLRTLQRIDSLAPAPIEVLIQVKLKVEPHKSGIDPADLAELVERAEELAAVRLGGLMLVPPLTVDPSPYFEQLAAIHEQLGGAERLPVLSMGMSRDFELAIAMGATMVRVGEAIFGPRRSVG